LDSAYDITSSPQTDTYVLPEPLTNSNDEIIGQLQKVNFQY